MDLSLFCSNFDGHHCSFVFCSGCLHIVKDLHRNILDPLSSLFASVWRQQLLGLEENKDIVKRVQQNVGWKARQRS